MQPDPNREGRRRFTPRAWHHDWHHLRELRRAISGVLRPLLEDVPAGGIVVDFGSGGSPYAPLFAEFSQLRYITCDIGGTPDILIAADTALPIRDRSADVVVSFQVLEHVADTGIYLGECRRLLKADGSLLLSTHGTWLYHPHPTDYRRWTEDGLRLELEKSGFAVEMMLGVVGPLAWTTQFRLFGYREIFLRLGFPGKLLTAMASLVMNARMLVEEVITPRAIRQQNACVYVAVAVPRPDRVAEPPASDRARR